MSGSLFAAGSRITAAQLNLLVPGTWSPVTLTITGGANVSGWTALQYRLLNSVELELMGAVAFTAGQTNPVIGTLPVGFRPLGTQMKTAQYLLPSATPGSSRLDISSAGTITLTSIGSTITAVGIGCVIPLDVS